MPNLFNVSDVFISYSRKDTAFVRRLYDALKEHDLEIWIDWEDIPFSVNWMAEIQAGIEAADAFVFVISPDSVISEVCLEELNIALANNKRFIPILYRDIGEMGQGSGKIHTTITEHNWLFFRETDDFDAAVANLIKTMRSDYDHIRQHTRLLVRATEWESNEWRKDFLLTGLELDTAQEWLETATAKVTEPAPTDLHKLYIETSRASATRSRRRFYAIVGAIVVFMILSLGLFVLWRISETNRIAARNAEAVALAAEAEARQSAQTARQSAVDAHEARQVAESVSESMRLALHAQTISEYGDNYSALPFALAAYDTANIAYAEVSLSNIALSPGPMDWLLEHTDTISEIDAHPAKLQVVTASRDESLIIWDLTADPPQPLHRLLAHTAEVRAVAYSPNGQYIVSGGNDSALILWDSQTGEVVRFLSEAETGGSLNVDQVAFSPDSRYVIASFEDLRGSGTGDDVHELRIFDSEDGRLVQLVGGVGYSAGSVAFSPDGRQFLGGMSDGQIWVWDFTPEPEIYAGMAGTYTSPSPPEPSGETVVSAEPEILPAHPAGRLVLDLEFNEDGTQLLSSSAQYDIILWDWLNRSIVHRLEAHTDTVEAVDFVNGKAQALSAGRDRNVILWDLETGSALQIMTGHESLPTALAVTHDGAFGVTGSLGRSVGIVWDLDVVEFSTDFFSLTDEVRRVAYHPDGELAATLSLDLPPGDDRPTLRLWNPATGEIVQEFPDHLSGGFDLAFALDNTAIVTALGPYVSLWDIASGEPIYERIDGNNTSIWDIDVHPDGTHVIGATNAGDLLLWNLETGQLEDTFRAVSNGQRLLTVVYNPDDPDQVFLSSNRFVYRYDLTERAVVQSYDGHTESVVGMAVNGEANLLVTSDFRRDVYVWNYETGNLRNVLTFHSAAVWGVDIDPSGRYVASAAENGEVLLWDLEINALLRRFDGYRQRIRSVAFSPDGNYLFFGEEDLHHIRLFGSRQLLDWIDEYRVLDVVSCAEQQRLTINSECDRTGQDTRQARTGEDLRGSVHMEAGETWIYRGTAGEVVTISVLADRPPPPGFAGFERRRAAGYLDTTVTVLDADGNVIAYNDDTSTGVYDSTITDLTLPEDGRYSIVVESYRGGTAGEYTLRVEQVSVPEAEATEEP